MFAASKTASVSGGYQISRSLRFNSADSAYLNRTPASAGNRRKWTWSGWVKRSEAGGQNIFTGGTGTTATTYLQLFFGPSADSLRVSTYVADLINTTSVYRDYSAWYHIVLNIDTDNATATNRMQLYVNNTLVATANVTGDLGVNQTQQHTIGNNTYGTYFGGYMTEINFIDGQALTPSSFGETNAQTGVWQPKAYSGSYGTNGFYLNFSDNSNTTAATLGKDYSGNGNNWTPNNFSVTAGAGNDSLVDSPTSYGTDTGAGGTVRGNYSTMNPLQNGMTNAPRNGNLEIAGSADIYRSIFNTIGVSSGKWYFEVVITTGSGVTNVAWSSSTSIYQYAGEASTSYAYELENGNKLNGGGSTAYGSALTTNDVFMCAADMDNLKLFFGKNGTWFASSDPVTGASPAYTFAAGTYFFQMRPYSASSSTVVTTNFGQRPFAYTAPSGYKALCTQNLPTPTIGATTATQAGKYFNTVLYTGTGSDNRAVTGVGFQPDFVWVKGRDIGQSHVLNNAVAGVGTAKTLYSNLSVSQGTYDDYGYLQSLDADGYTIKNGSINGNLVNASGYQYVAWNWKANGSGSTNTAGSITSTVSANTTSGFSIITWTGNATQGATIGHGLGAVPALLIFKNRSVSATEWPVKSNQLSTNSYLYLNATNASASYSFFWSADPTSSLIYLGSDNRTNGSGNSMVCYAFAEVAGYSKFGSYTGNGSADGPFVFAGMKPAYLLLKRTDSANSWIVYDTTRDTYNVAGKELLPDSSAAEATYPILDFLSNGFKLRNNAVSVNASGGTYIYMAFASAPFKFSLGR